MFRLRLFQPFQRSWHKSSRRPLRYYLNGDGPAREHRQMVGVVNEGYSVKKDAKPLVGHLGAGLVPPKPSQNYFYSPGWICTHQLRWRSAHGLWKAWEGSCAIRVISHCSKVGNLFHVRSPVATAERAWRKFLLGRYYKVKEGKKNGVESNWIILLENMCPQSLRWPSRVHPAIVST